jgi:CDP-diacylglycerol--glycerol-3-phosphate 3-phosphatidyltransferase
MERVTGKGKPKTFTDVMRIRFSGVLNRAGFILDRMGLTPNILTALGLLGNLVSGVLLAMGYITYGGIVALIMVPFDALDGAVARYQGSVSTFGAFLDSVTDRYSETLLFGGLLVYFLREQEMLSAGLVFAAVVGSLLVSYVKARAEAVGFSANTGILTRLERMLVLVPCLLFNRPVIAVWVIAILANLTAIQRIVFVYRESRSATSNRRPL